MRKFLCPSLIALALVAAMPSFGGPLSPLSPSGAQLEAVAPCSFVDVGLNSAFDGALTTSDCPLSGSYADYYRFFASAGTTVTANLHSTVLGNVLLSIQDFNTGAIIAHSDAVPNPNVSLRVTADSLYLVRIWSADPQIPTGAYHLKLTGTKNANGCSTDTNVSTLCVDSDRFKIQVAWSAVHLGTQGTGTAVSMTPDTGSFWFFSSSNVELVVKVLDGRPVNGHFWVFFGALTNVEYTLTVTDTSTGAVRTYTSAQDTQASVSDTSAF
ncbi:MAG: hypothetical protein ACRD16_12740 [Thermoanaerobaculia bacterium]